MMMLAWVWPIEFEQPWWLLAALAAPLLVLLSRRSLAGLEPAQRWGALALRSLVWLAAVGALAGATFLRENESLSVLFVLDRSRSIPEQLLRQQEAYIRSACDDMPAEDRAGVVSLAGQANIEQLPSRGGIHFDQLPAPTDPERTNISQALKMAMATFPEDTAKRIVLLSDGNENVGDALGDAQAAAAAGVALDVWPMHYSHRSEVFLDRMAVPAQAYQDEEVPIRLSVRSRQPISGRIEFYHDGRPVDLDPDSAELGQNVVLREGINALQLRLPLRAARAHRFEARFLPDDPAADSIAQNNVATGLTVVTGGNRVLLVTADPAADAALADALRREGVEVVLQRVEDARLDLVELESYSAVILANLPAHDFADVQHEALSTYVKDLGGGLIMIGGNEAFGAGGWIGSPVEEVMPVAFDVKDKKIIPRGALVIINHTCELPRGNYWGEQVALKAVDTISTRDYIGVLAYTWGRGVDWEVPLQLNTNRTAIKNRIRQMQIGDMPDFAETMEMAVKGLQGTDAAQKHMIIISDGDASPPNDSTLKAMQRAKITCSTVAIGYGVHVTEFTLRDIATKTGGRFYACRNPMQLPKIFVKESKIVRRSLIDEQPFQPLVDYGWSDVLGALSTADLPRLGGIVVTTAKPLAEVPLAKRTKEGKDPLLAYWQSGLGRTVAFTSGWWPYWGQSWASWQRFGNFWAQIVRWAMRQGETADLDVTTRVEGDRGFVTVEAGDTEAAFQKFLEIGGAVIDPEMEAAPIRLEQTGPGRYEASFEVAKDGQYLLNLQYGAPGERKRSLRVGLSVPYSPEYRELSTNDAVLAQLKGDNGRWLDGDPKADDVFAHNLPPCVSRQPVWEWIVAWLVLPLFMIDVATRRLASSVALSIFVELALLLFLLFGLGIYKGPWWGWLGAILFAELVGWSLRYRAIGPTIEFFTYTVATLGRAGERSGRRLSRLRQVRDEARQRLARGETAMPTAEPTTDEKAAARRRRQARFDVGGEVGAGQPAEDLTEALGGAREAAPPQTKPAAKPGESAEEMAREEKTSRLFEAKKKARKEIDDRGKDGS
ncbi:MAG: VWA domain-containing protein [Phycisphaerales bacterium]|nr:MAG: VWA domain-containing protein [Phycisphaerales bacterium]